MANQASSAQGAVCAGNGLDSSAEGVLGTLLITSLVGLLIWLIFAVLRPRLPHLYAVREWFPRPDLRPPHLGSGLFAFCHPPVPLVPSLPSDTSNLGQSAAGDARLFPSDEELTQRTLWVAFLIALGWTILGLAGALPLYISSTPCLADSSPTLTQGSAYSTLTDLSLLRLLKLLDNNTISTSRQLPSRSKRAVIDGVDQSSNAQGRLIALTTLLIVVGILPVMWKLFKEFNKVVAHRWRWLELRCGGVEMGWLSIYEAPGFVGWSEGRVKEFFQKNGLSTGLDRAKTPKGPQRDARSPSGEREEVDEDGRPEVDVQGVYTVPDTSQLSELIAERDRVLNELEEAEAKYIASFRLTQPDHADFEPEAERSRRRSTISFTRSTGHRRSRSRGSGAASPTPTSYLAPKSYYKLKNVDTVTDRGHRDYGPLADQRPRPQDVGPSPLQSMPFPGVSGSRFQEMHNDGIRFVAVPPEYPMPSEESGPRTPGPNHVPQELATDEFGRPIRRTPGTSVRSQALPSSGISPEPSPDTPAADTNKHPFPPPAAATVEGDMMNPAVQPASEEEENLPLVYREIRQARTKLKVLNAQINDLQQDGFNHIADGVWIRGWLIFGRGIRYIPGIEMIEGRSKEDVRWDELQQSRGAVKGLVWWLLVAAVGICLAAALLPVVGLAFAGAPNFAEHLPFLRPLARSDDHNFGVAIATTLVPAVVASLFIAIAIYFIHYSSRYNGKPSVSTMRLTAFKGVFAVLVIICGVWLVALGGILFATDSFNGGQHRPAAVSEGMVYIAILLMLITINLAIIAPGLLMLQPVRLWKTWKAQKTAVTPRQRFRAIYPRSYNPSFGLGCCILAVVFACAFFIIFPLIGPPIVLLLILTLVAHRYLAGYVFAHAGVGQTGGLMHIWLLRRFATLVALQPLLFGLVLLSRRQWTLGGILLGTALVIVVSVETYAHHKTRLAPRRKLAATTRDALSRFQETARRRGARPKTVKEEEVLSNGSAPGVRRPRTSMASILDMISLTLAIMPSSTRRRGPVPLDTEGMNDLVSTERAARTRPGAVPRVAFKDRAEETGGMLYPPELLAPTPIIWLPNDPNGVGRSEAFDLTRYHGLEVTLDPVNERRHSNDTQSRRRSSLGQTTPTTP
ncbi:hypothetical protein FRC05_004147 [Tulasnella sp. 425]|nr:hypothetical protein FRC05_004147 [Tulasnella sp. 425]